MATNLTPALQRIATRWAQMLTTIAKEFAPNHIKEYIHSRTSQESEGKFSITVSVDLNANPVQKYGSADARAQELGSGLHTTQYGRMDYIPILPKQRKFLAFHWEVADADPSRFRFLPDGRVMLRSVKSPGIHPYKGLGYLKPAVEELRAQGKDDLDKEIRQAVTSDLRIAFKHAK